MKIVAALLVFLFIAILEVTFLDNVRIASVKPELFLVAVIYISLFWGRKPGMFFGFASGIFLDLFSPRHMGVNALLLMSAGFLIGSLAASLYREKFISQVLILLVTSVVESLAYYAFTAGSAGAFLFFFMRYGLLGALYTAVVGTVVFFAFHMSRSRLAVT
jgi:rod shape-determining protein MreD